FPFISRGGNVLVLQPDGRAHGASGMKGVVGPIAAGIGEIESPRIRHRADLEAALATERAGEPLDRAPVARPPMSHEDAELFAVASDCDPAMLSRRVHDVADVPIEAIDVNAKDVLALAELDVGFCEHRIGDGHQLGLLQPARWLPKAGLAGAVQHETSGGLIGGPYHAFACGVEAEGPNTWHAT